MFSEETKKLEESLLTEAKRAAGELRHEGVTVIKDVLTDSELNILHAEVARLEEKHGFDARSRSKFELSGCSLSTSFPILRLASLPVVVATVCSFLGWNISVSHASLVLNPQQSPNKPPMDWHQDGGRINLDLQGARPPLSVKAAIWLTDGSTEGCGTFYYLPQSQACPVKPHSLMANAVPVLVSPGDVILFDRRVWHRRKPNTSVITRKVIFIDYSQRWLESKQNINLDSAFIDSFTKEERQLWNLEAEHWRTFAPRRSESPLREWMERNDLTTL